MYWLRSFFRKQHTELELDSELRFHLEQRAAELANAGLAPEEARRQAQIDFGGLEGVKQDCRESRRAHMMETLLQDLRYGLRIMWRAPAFSVAAVLTLALGIGATTAVFSIVNAILLKPLPYPEPEEIVIPWRLTPPGVNLGFNEAPWGRLDFQIMAGDAKTFQSLGAFKSESFSLTGMGDPQLLEGLKASAGFFPALGVVPAMGRTFTAEEDQPGHDHEVVLSYGLWRDQFGASPRILGQAIQLDGSAYTVIGIMPAGFIFPRGEEMPGSFNFPRAIQFWVPLALSSGPVPKDEPQELAVVGRLKPGKTIDQAQAEMNVFSKRLEILYGRVGRGWFNSRVTPLSRQVTGDTRRPLLLILGAVGVVLSLACSNVAGLLLARSLGRRREFTLRAALGAAHRRLMRQLLTESLLLAAAGGILGVFLAAACIRLTKIFGPSSIPRLHEAGLDPWVLAFALGTTLATGILFGLAPAIGASRANLVESLKEGGSRSAGSAGTPRIRKVLLVSQMALAVVLAAAAGLLGRTFFQLLSVDPGFNAEHVLTFQSSLPPSTYPRPETMVAFYQRALEQLRSVAGVQSAAIVETVPMDGGPDGSSIRIPDHPQDPKTSRFANYTIASPGYFSAVGTPLLRGRGFLETDTADSLQVVVINNAMAKKYWPGEDPLGKQVGLASTRFPLMVIVGIAADVKHLSLREDPGPEMYVPYTQNPFPSMATMRVVLRTQADPASVIGGVRQSIHSVDPDLPVAKVTTLRTIVSNSLAQLRFSLLLLGAFAALAVLLAAIGMYGVISHSVSQRAQEIGIRMALGARRGSVFAMVLGQGARLAGLGILIGLIATLGISRMMVSFLYGVRGVDPATFAMVALLLAAVALAACYVPARRAMRTDPMVALRSE
jgi:predicted permease